MKISRITTALSFAALVASAVPAMALKTPTERGNRAANSNRAITRAEWRGDLARFDQLDTNRDGVLTQDEMQQARGKHAKANKQERFRGMDRNGDGVITRDEWRGNDESFRNQDRNGDGVLSGDELRGKGHGKNRD